MKNLHALQKGLSGSNVKDVFRLYLYSLLIISPIAIFLSIIFGGEFLFYATPFLVVLITGFQYSFCHFYKSKKITSQKPNFSLLTEPIKLERKGLPRSIECLLALAGLIFLFPLFLLCALLIWISSPGSIFFRQKCVGRNGKVFTKYRFRTIIEAPKGSLTIEETDRKSTSIGRILRKTKLYELPAIYNVLRGDMSFVGPYPETVEFVDINNPFWKIVLSVRPGITDPATLQLRNLEAFLAPVEDKKKFYLEVIQPYRLVKSIQYLKSRSFISDLKIILQTLKLILHLNNSSLILNADDLTERKLSITKTL